MPSNCATRLGHLRVRHNPAAYYTNIATTCAARDVPLGAAPDLSARVHFVTPDLCNDTHDCSVPYGDAWLATFLPRSSRRPSTTPARPRCS